jgi:TonB family protein
MNSKLKDTPTSPDMTNGLDDLFADLLKSKNSQPKSDSSHDMLLSKFLDEEMDGRKPESLSPDLDQKLTDALREIGLDSNMHDINAAGKATPTNVPVAETPIQAVIKESSLPEPASAQKSSPIGPVKPVTSGSPVSEKATASAVPTTGRAKGMATPAKPSATLSITSSASVQTSGGSKTKLILFGLIGLAAVGALTFYFMSGSKSPSTPLEKTAQVESPLTPSTSSPSAETSGPGTAATGSPAAVSKPSGSKAEPAPANRLDPKAQTKPGLPSSPPAATLSGVTTWSVTESLGNTQSLPTPATSVVRGPDMPMPVAMAPNATVPATSPSKPLEPAILMTPPQPITKVSPIVPEIVRKLKMSGIVTINAKVDEKGRVTSAVAQSGPVMLRNSAEGAVRQWKFKPALSNGTPIASETTILVNYK